MNIKCCPYGILKFSYSLKYVRLIENLWKFQISNFTQIIMHKQYLHDKSFLLVWLIIEFHFTQNSFKANQFLGHCCLSDWNSMGLKWMVISLVCEMMKELWISPHLCPKPIFWGGMYWMGERRKYIHALKIKKISFYAKQFLKNFYSWNFDIVFYTKLIIYSENIFNWNLSKIHRMTIIWPE